MASLSVRKIDDEFYEQLRVRAAKHGVSMEEKVRQILKRTIEAPEHLGNLALEYFGQENGVELDIPNHKPQEPLDFNGVKSLCRIINVLFSKLFIYIFCENKLPKYLHIECQFQTNYFTDAASKSKNTK